MKTLERNGKIESLERETEYIFKKKQKKILKLKKNAMTEIKNLLYEPTK